MNKNYHIEQWIPLAIINIVEFRFPDLTAAELMLIVKHKQTKNKKHKTSWEPTAFTCNSKPRQEKNWRPLISESDIQIILTDEYLSH